MIRLMAVLYLMKNLPMRKEILFPVIIGFLLLTIAILSVLHFFWRRNPALLRHKIKLGLIVLSLQALISGCGNAEQTGDVISCYAKPMIKDNMSLMSNHYKKGRYLYKSGGDTIFANVSNREGTHFSFAIKDTTGQTLFSGAFNSSDGAYNSEWESLYATTPGGVKPGEYRLFLYPCESSASDASKKCMADYPVSFE